MENEILIVGAGPVGMMLACILVKNGIKACIVDKRQHASSMPRAINISSPVLKIFDELEMGQYVLKNGLKLNELKVFWHTKPLLNINYKYYKPEYPYFFHLEQSSLEAYLNDYLSNQGVEIKRGISVKDMTIDKDRVKVCFSNQNGNEWYETYKYVIGCDGGKSTIRDLSGITYEQKNYDAHFVLIDGELSYQSKNISNKLHYYLSESGYLILAPITDKRCRIIFSVKGSMPAHDNHIDLDWINKFLIERGVSDFHVKKILWSTKGDFFHRICETAQKGNVFLVGDAMHQFSPIGGANMNVGIQDAYSLGNKLINHLNASCANNDLFSYSAERIKVANQYVEITKSMTNILTRVDDIPRESEYLFMPTMKNRNFIKYILPRMFSGEYFSN